MVWLYYRKDTKTCFLLDYDIKLDKNFDFCLTFVSFIE